MQSVRRFFQKPFFWAVTLHVLLFSFLMLHFAASPAKLYRLSDETLQQPIIHATAISQQAVNKIVRDREQAKQNALAEQRAKIERTKRIAAEKVRKKRRAAEAKRRRVLAEKKRTEEKAAKVRAEKQAAARKLAAAKAARIKEKLAAKRAAEARRILAEKQKKAEAARVLAAQRLRGEIDRYRALIVSAIAQNWVIDKRSANLKCVLEIHLAPGGVVLDVKLVQSSGDSALDTAAMKAVYAASPLPVPSDPALFDRFRLFQTTMTPQGSINGSLST